MVTQFVLEEKTKDNYLVMNGEKEIENQYSFLQGDTMKIGEVNVSREFVNSLSIKNFFQYTRNAFDYASQVINEIFVETTQKFSRVDFEKISKNPNVIKNIDIANWVAKMSSSSHYVYINDYCNQTKHNFDMGVEQSLDLSTLDISCEILPFEKNGRFYAKENGSVKMEEIYKFASTEFVDFWNIVEGYLINSRM